LSVHECILEREDVSVHEILTFSLREKTKKTKAIKLQEGTLRMPRDWPAKKDVVSYEKPRGAAKQVLIRGYPNGVTP
jgi:hypothetical protein